MAVLPFFHIYGMNTIMNLTLYRRGTLVTMPKMELPTFLDLVQSRRVTYLYIAPPIAVALAKHPIVDDYDLSSIRRIDPAADSACRADRLRRAGEVFRDRLLVVNVNQHVRKCFGVHDNGGSGRQMAHYPVNVLVVEGIDPAAVRSETSGWVAR